MNGYYGPVAVRRSVLSLFALCPSHRSASVCRRRRRRRRRRCRRRISDASSIERHRPTAKITAGGRIRAVRNHSANQRPDTVAPLVRRRSACRFVFSTRKRTRRSLGAFLPADFPKLVIRIGRNERAFRRRTAVKCRPVWQAGDRKNRRPTWTASTARNHTGARAFSRLLPHQHQRSRYAADLLLTTARCVSRACRGRLPNVHAATDRRVRHHRTLLYPTRSPFLPPPPPPPPRARYTTTAASAHGRATHRSARRLNYAPRARPRSRPVNDLCAHKDLIPRPSSIVHRRPARRSRVRIIRLLLLAR